ncbi:MAG: S-methyl-5'-thioadenosine phosphorylase [Candidatus Aenigmarchaeota archaeon]|nr:S-methyl-5'-thioadenosine phosphorylase [Candidatus Aenigmarchaeota archaeon]
MRARIAIIGGTGIYDSEIFENAEIFDVKTPHGKPSDSIKIAEYKGMKVALLPRHGRNHTIPPHKINFQANLHALKTVGVERIIGTAAVGSLKKDYERGDVVFPDQLIDWGKNVITFYNGPDVRHIAFADPFCPELRDILIGVAKSLNIKHHSKGVYLRISGPRFSTRAESMMFRQFGDIIGMTCVPEAVLARELGICYAVIATVTDYDVWADEPVDVQTVVKTMKENAKKVETILKAAIPKIPEKHSCDCAEAPEKAKF